MIVPSLPDRSSLGRRPSTPATGIATGTPTITVELLAGAERAALRVIGELDVATHDALAALLAAQLDALRSAPLVDLDLSGLEFCDVEGGRQLLALASGLGAADRTVSLVGARPQVARLLSLLGHPPAA